MNKLRKQKKGDLLSNVFVVIITLIIFFALYPAVKTLLDVAISVNAGNDPTLDFMVGLSMFVILFGMLKWILNTTVSGEQ